MGNIHSRHQEGAEDPDVLSKRRFSFRFGSEVERLFYEDCDLAVVSKRDTSALSTTPPPPASASPQQSSDALLQVVEAEENAHTSKPTAQSIQRSTSTPTMRDAVIPSTPGTCPPDNKWLPVAPASTQARHDDEPSQHLNCSSKTETAPSCAAMETEQSGSRPPPDEHLELPTGEERWKRRLRQRMADREANDEEKRRLSKMSMMSLAESQLGDESSPEQSDNRNVM